MVKKTITYTDYNNVERTEDFYFNLSKAECAEMQLTTEGGLSEKLKAISDAKDQAGIFKFFKELLLKSYGIKSPDGKRFEKSEEISKAFSETEAYSEMFMELGSDDVKAAAFIKGILPKIEQPDKPAISAPVH